MKIQIETYGCTMNRADSEAMAGLLAESGFEFGDNGILIVNTCTVKTPTERKILKRLERLRGRKVIVSGCLPSAEPSITEKFPEFSFLGMNVEDIVNAVRAVENGDRFVRIKEGRCRLELPRRRENPLVGIIPIAQGCAGDCSFCITRLARGRLVSYPRELILENIERVISEGVREIWLTAQDVGAYGIDIGENLPDLLRDICKIRGRFKVRVGMMNPSHVLKILDELILAYKDEKIYKFLHIPVQSGDDKVLRDMNRRYTVNDFRRIVFEFRKNFPEMTISTDVIVGFPTEDDRAFERTVNLIEDVRPEVLNVSRFWTRPGTRAEKLRALHGRITKYRSRIMNGVFRKIGLQINRKWIGWEGRALVSERGKRGGFCARNLAYKPIILHSDEDLLGRSVNVRVTDATYYDLRGETI
ncbi:MAG TPA: tRNA (N(6)-L-threonylcarbamoyladenosine(37)-C(2))-methylthiotransferase [Candidatus Altiarchaeales archaeon]|nr:tRNA (N(6)-L-threonylcarbamoyladenosine(37)-C(2))-methylthiotransferase [Candidatus Altiarchaeales archaeon]